MFSDRVEARMNANWPKNGPVPARPSDDLLVHVSRRAMASEFEVCFPADPYPQGTDLALDALAAVDALEERLSFFRPASEISRINLLAGEEPVEVEPGLFELLRLAMQLHAETDGAYDITSTPLWETWGFARRAGSIPSAEQLAEARGKVGGHLVELDATRRTIRFRQADVRINLGSIGKGYCARPVLRDVACRRHGRFPFPRRAEQRARPR